MEIKILNLIICLIDSFLLFLLINCFNFRKEEFNKKLIPIVIVFQGFIIYFISGVVGEANLLSTILMLCIYSAILKYIFSSRYIQIIATAFLATVILALLEFIGINIAIALFKVPVDFYLVKNITFFQIAFSIRFFVAIVVLTSSKYLKRVLHIKPRIAYQILLVSIMNLMIVFIIVWMYKYIDFEQVNINVFIGGIVLGIVIFTSLSINLMRKIIGFTAKEIEWELREHGYIEQTKNAKNFTEMLETIKAQQHDFKFHLNTILSLAYNKKYDEVVKYISEVDNSIQNYEMIINTNDPILSSLLSMKYSKARSKDIDVAIDIDSIENDIVESTDLTIILGNILDNAIEACEKVKRDEKLISLSIFEKKRYFCIQQCNSKNKGVFFSFSRKFTTKDNYNDHGYGLANVRYVVEKYNGTLSVKDHGSKFDLKIYIPTKSSD